MFLHKARTRKLEANKTKKKWIWSFIVTEIREFKGPSQISEIWKTFTEKTTGQKSKKIKLFKKDEYSNNTPRAAYQNLTSYAGVSTNKPEKVVDIVLT